MFVGPIYLTPHHHPHAPARRLPTRSCSGHRRTRYAEHPTDFGNGQPFVAWRLVLRSCVVRPFGQSFPQPAVEPTLQLWFPSVENLQPIPLAAPGGSKFEIAVCHFCSRSIRPAVARVGVAIRGRDHGSVRSVGGRNRIAHDHRCSFRKNGGSWCVYQCVNKRAFVRQST